LAGLRGWILAFCGFVTDDPSPIIPYLQKRNLTFALGVDFTMPDPTLKNVFEAILKYGHDEDFAPKNNEAFKATQAPAGTREKLEVLAERVRSGHPLWHEDDRADYTGLTGAIRPRD
jgi:hypothetical protein